MCALVEGGDVKNIFMSETASSRSSVTATIADKKGYAKRWKFSPRHIDNLIALGLPHLKIGKRRVRIVIEEADHWMRERFSTQRCKSASKIQHPSAALPPTAEPHPETISTLMEPAKNNFKGSQTKARLAWVEASLNKT
jgi:hypothetical protein